MEESFMQEVCMIFETIPISSALYFHDVSNVSKYFSVIAAQLTRVTSLRRLAVDPAPAFLEFLPALPLLTSLELKFPSSIMAQFRPSLLPLMFMTSLRSLSLVLRSVPVGGSTLRELSRLCLLECLQLNVLYADCLGPSIGRLTGLRELYWVSSASESLTLLRALTGLTSLTVSAHSIEDLLKISSFSRLLELRLQSSTPAGKPLTSLSFLPASLQCTFCRLAALTYNSSVGLCGPVLRIAGYATDSTAVATISHLTALKSLHLAMYILIPPLPFHQIICASLHSEPHSVFLLRKTFGE
jgi:hypothetical protein